MEQNNTSRLVTKTVLVSRLPPTTSKTEIQDLFSDGGPIKKCYMVRNGDHEFTGVAYITYAVSDDATKAVERFDKTVFGKNTIQVKFSKQRDKPDNKQDLITEPIVIKQEKDVSYNDTTIKKQKKPYVSKENKKQFKEIAKGRRGRVIIRNLSFKADEKSLAKHFSPYGTINEVIILRRHGKMVGCAFVQFDSYESAKKAVEGCHKKPHLGRVLTVDIAVPKSEYNGRQAQTVAIKEEDPDETVIKQEPQDELVSSPIKEEIKEESETSDDDDDDSDEADESDSEDDGSNIKNNQSFNNDKVPVKSNAASKDVAEGRTLFISNLSFDATEEDLTEVLSKFGKLKYVLLCIDRLTEHPRGTAFAQFIKKTSADACLAAGDDLNQQEQFIIQGRTFRISRALSREELTKKKDVKEMTDDKSKDKRNLYLAREGFIREGTIAAKDVSNPDIMLRHEREKYKRRLLQNLHVFVSSVRLCIHNIPENMSDKQLRDIFTKNSPVGAKITEARIMRDLQNVDKHGTAKSKEFGFIAFSQHEHALSTLRAVNNNPIIFTKNRRPIVEFSLENRSVLKAREKRSLKSMKNNPNKNNNFKSGSKHMEKGSQQNLEVEKTSYMGSISNVKQKGKVGLPSHTGPKIRHKDGNKKHKITRNQLKRDSAKAFGKKHPKGNNFKPSKKRKLNK